VEQLKQQQRYQFTVESFNGIGVCVSPVSWACMLCAALALALVLALVLVPALCGVLVLALVLVVALVLVLFWCVKVDGCACGGAFALLVLVCCCCFIDCCCSDAEAIGERRGALDSM
jgi:hypothetical protein